jgi:hypothetical protein
VAEALAEKRDDVDRRRLPVQHAAVERLKRDRTR